VDPIVLYERVALLTEAVLARLRDGSGRVLCAINRAILLDGINDTAVGALQEPVSTEFVEINPVL
jgi:hypothetical protein